jgi:hypothetical protein
MWGRLFGCMLCFIWSLFQCNTQALSYRSYFTPQKTSKEVTDPVIQEAAKVINELVTIFYFIIFIKNNAYVL